ncbi:MAG TPA: TetR/AcrR family transcriptional regulator [Paraburkholderia sp.]|uniref:TetR/AcrR family transcriptional regulator n=1 Tax=Paraburkholderia sp. TaxID=1926495 RepID=UPI002C5F6F19|nr:TetR/AcrR family transcriptional regulator [Paraburkholderia sp.]HTR09394.1 TetR/AcrR family transcriptional regulator [Paraburkholderia sp.]
MDVKDGKKDGRQVSSAQAGHHPAARRPSQSRGQARVDAILDTAAAIIAGEGLAALTMHGLARRAQTSIGSLYHFFPDRDSVMRALIDRHEAAGREINLALSATAPNVWQQFSPAEAIARGVGPYIDYVQNHPDFFALLQGRRLSENFIGAVRTVLSARLPTLGAADRERYAAMFHAIASGVMQMVFVREPEHVSFYMHEVPRVLAAYLAEIEAAIGGIRL